MSHLVNFMGTDTLAGIIYADEYYNSGMVGFSVPASEHSVACSFGKDAEDKYFETMITKYPKGIVSIVSDTYNVFEFVETMSVKYRDEILGRDGTIVFRPDSGDPVEVNDRLIDVLWNIFGGTYTDNHYKVLDPHVRLIQGDGIDIDMIEKILSMLKAKKFSAENIVFGSGGGLLQKFDRDTNQFAIKASYREEKIEGAHGYIYKGFDISKKPIDGSKASKAGKLKLHKAINAFTTLTSFNEPGFESFADSLELVFENGEIKREQSFDEIRKIANKYLEIETKPETVHA